MNLHAIANPVIQIVLQNTDVALKSFAGILQNEYFERVPSYNVSIVSMNCQDLSSEQLRIMNNLNIQGEMKIVISPVALKGVSRVDQLGGDILNFDGYDWLVVHVDETFPDHCKAIVQKQLTQSQLINHAPVASDYTYTTTNNVVLAGNLIADCCSDADSDLLSIIAINGLYFEAPVNLDNGILTVANNGVFSYENTPDNLAGDVFNFTVSDGKGGNATATVTIQVLAGD